MVAKYGQGRLLWREVSGESFHQQPVQATFIHSSHSSVAMVPVQEEGRLVEIGPWGSVVMGAVIQFAERSSWEEKLMYSI